MARGRPFGLLALVLLPLLLAAGAAPPADCPSDPASEQSVSAPDRSGGLTGQSFANFGGDIGCRRSLPVVTQPATLRSESGDVLHGLPAPDIAHPVEEQQRAAQFQ